MTLFAPCSAVQLCQYAGSALGLKQVVWNQVRLKDNLASCAAMFTALMVVNSDQVGWKCYVLALSALM